MDLGHRLTRPMPIALRAAVALQVLWMAAAPGQHLLSHASPDLASAGPDTAAVSCVEPLGSPDSSPGSNGTNHAACAVCLLLAVGSCLPARSVPATFAQIGSASSPLAAPAQALGADLLASIHARAPPRT
jgi:hypothetical protein